MPILKHDLLATKAKDLQRSQWLLHEIKLNPALVRYLHVSNGFIHARMASTGELKVLGRLQFKYLDLFTRTAYIEHWEVTGGRETNIISDIRGVLLQRYGLNVHLRFPDTDLYQVLGQTPPIGQVHGAITT